MKRKFASQLQADDELLNEPFMLHDVVRRTTRDDRPYLLCVLSDKSGRVNCVFWSVPEDINEWVRPGQVVLVTGRVVTYKDALQVTATDLNLWQNPDLADFLPTSQRPLEEMEAELREVIDSLGPPYEPLVRHLLLDDQFLPRFRNAPAARKMHHAYVGGLLEHTLSMAALANMLADHYPFVDRDLLVSGALLHDMGKVHEYVTEASFGPSDDGRLVGHILRAVIMIEKAADAVGDLRPDEVRHLVHLVAAHHGTQEWGSPVVPKTLEAILLHQIDLIDSRAQGFYDHWREDGSDELWSLQPSPMYRTELRRPAAFSRDADSNHSD